MTTQVTAPPTPFRRLMAAGRDGSWLTTGRIVGIGQILFLIELTVLVMLALWQHGVTTNEPSNTSSDFVSFYAAGKLALAGTPALAYDQAAHALVEQQFSVAGAQYQFFFYPPVLMLLFAPLALLPYSVAFYVFEAATLALFLFAMGAVLRVPGWSWLAPVLAFPAIFWTFGLGQNAFLTASLFAGFTLLVDRRPASAGTLLGLICYKPHFGLLVPVALAFGGHWRAFLAAAATVAIVVLLSLALFGAETWQAYLTAFAHSDSVYSSGLIDYGGIVTPFGAARLLGLEPSAAYLVQGGFTVAMAGLVALVWRGRSGLAVRAATVLAATLLAVPLALLYDRLLLLVAIGWLVRDARENGFRPWDKTVLALVYLAAVFEYAITSACPVPLGPMISVTVLALAARRVVAAPVTRTTGALPEAI